MQKIKISAQFCVVGGGLSGLCAAISAARCGIKTLLMHDRSVLGGNASSEIRMWVCGARGQDNRETGIIEEILLENFYQNPAHKYAIWDSVLYEKALLEPNLKLLLNCSCLDARVENDCIKSITGWQSNSQTFYEVSADYFADCSGDSILAPLTGAEYMYGRESRSDYNESIAPDKGDKQTMGMSCLFQIRETDHKTHFTPRPWAYTYKTDDELPETVHHLNDNFWWIEYGGTKDCIHDTDECRDELLKIAYGVWDHIKNQADHGADNWELEWIGFLPGKRESIRYKGAHVITQNDVSEGGNFHDLVAYAGWSMDNHFPEGFYYRGGHPTIYNPAPSPWGIPFRSLYSRNIKNLLFAGRNISATHVALSSSRVMATCSILGQAVGTAVSVMLADNSTPDNADIQKIQKQLMLDDCFLPGLKREISPITQSADCNAEIVRNGIDRGEDNCWHGKDDEYIEYKFSKPQKINKIRLVFDSNLNRKYQNMPCNHKLVEERFYLPETLIKEYSIILTDDSNNTKKIHINDNHQRLVWHNVDTSVKSVKLLPHKTWGCETFNIFSFELI